MYLGRYAGSSGEYHLDDDLVVLDVYPSLTARTIYVGYSGDATFTESGNTTTCTIQNTITAGYNAGSTGNMTINGGTFTAPYDLTLGQWGTGNMTVSGGQVNIGRDVWVALMTGGRGALTLAGGEVDVTGRVIGYAGSSINFDGGDLTVGSGQISADNITVSSVGGRTGHLNLASGTITAGIMSIGYNHAGTMTQMGGTLSVNSDLLIGSAGFQTATLTLSGTASAHVVGDVLMGGANGIGQIEPIRRDVHRRPGHDPRHQRLRQCHGPRRHHVHRHGR